MGCGLGCDCGGWRRDQAGSREWIGWRWVRLNRSNAVEPVECWPNPGRIRPDCDKIPATPEGWANFLSVRVSAVAGGFAPYNVGQSSIDQTPGRVTGGLTTPRGVNIPFSAGPSSEWKVHGTHRRPFGGRGEQPRGTAQPFVRALAARPRSSQAGTPNMIGRAAKPSKRDRHHPCIPIISLDDGCPARAPAMKPARQQCRGSPAQRCPRQNQKIALDAWYVRPPDDLVQLDLVADR